MSTVAAEIESMTCKDFADSIEDEISTLVDEQYWDGGQRTESFFRFLKRKAHELGVVLTDVEEWNYETYYDNFYRCTERGLS